ncbi:MAG TPA: trypsin-like peptidase domain-containing protein [Micromonosporaceae bacterium]
MTTRAVTYWISAATVAAVIGTAALAGATHHDAITGSGSVAEAAPGGGQAPSNPNISMPRRTTTGTTSATSTQQAGIVTVVSALKYQQAESAGTGMILNSDGEILTNNHVIDGATSTRVTVESTGRTYRADVVGTDPTDDVAVLQMRNASGLTTAKIGDSSGVSVGDAVIGVGNAGGTGALTASSGSITALHKSITASDGSGQDSERLSGLIAIDAPIISGDSGGPLYNSAGQIIGMDTAASANRVQTAAYAIPIDQATAIAAEIERGVETTSIHIGYPGFLGIGTAIDNTTKGVGVANVLPGGPAARAGMIQGVVITRVGGKAVHSGTALRALLSTYDPGTSVRVIWIDPGGKRHASNVTLATGPAD